MITNWIRYFQRETSGRQVIREIDGFRFFAIGTVLLYHLNTHFRRTILESGIVTVEPSWLISSVSRGSLGVDVFFAISGFILALPFARQRLFNEKPVSLSAYYVRRLTRLEPPYVISLVLLLLVHLLVMHESLKAILPNFLASLFYVHSIVFDAWSKINPVVWSLEVEVQFYILAPVMAMVFSIRNATWRRSIIVLMIIASIMHADLNYHMIKELHLRKSLLMYLHQFLIGFLFADFYLTDWRDSLKEKSYGFDVMGFIALGLLFVFNVSFESVSEFIFIGCLFVSFIALFKGKFINRFFTNSWTVIIGGMCYSIYLLHYALIAFLSEYSIHLVIPGLNYSLNYCIQIIVLIPMVILISAVFFALIEKPCMNKEWPARLYARVKAIFAPV